MFSANSNRYATFGVISKTPGPIIDEIWGIIDNNLQGVFPLQNVLRFDFMNVNGKLQVHFSEAELQTELSFDLDYEFDTSFPDTVMGYDDGNAQTILLPEELNED